MHALAITALQKKFEAQESSDGSMREKMMDFFKRYLLMGALPAAVNACLETKNIWTVREIQHEIHDYYAADAPRYDRRSPT